MQTIVFKRSIRGGRVTGDPTLVIFSDDSQESFGTCAIARWRLSNGKYESHLIAVKEKNCPNLEDICRAPGTEWSSAGKTRACYEIKKSIRRLFDTSRWCRKLFSISYAQ